MKKQVMRLLALPLTAMLVAGCAGEIAKEEVGALIGAGLGGLAGAFIGDGGGQLVAVGVGTLFGAFLGTEIGKSLDRADRLAMAQAQQQGLEYGHSGSTTAWENPDSGNSGEIIPQPAYRRADGTYCREFWETVTIAGEKQQAYGTACRQPDGSWKLS
jgi:surface antigen